MPVLERPEPLPEAEVAQLRALCRTYAIDRVATALGVSRTLLLSAAAGLDVAPRNAERLRAGLARVEGVNVAQGGQS